MCYRSYFEYITAKDNIIILKCVNYTKNYEKEFDKHIAKRFEHICRFYGRDINKFILMLRRGVYSHEYIDRWQNLNETSLLDKKELYTNLNVGANGCQLQAHKKSTERL